MAPATRHDETNTLVVPTSESDIVSAQGTGRKYAGVIALFALVAVIVGGVGMHRRSVQSNTQDAEIGDIIEACADYTVQASCSAASCNWNSATVQCEEAAHRQKKAANDEPYVVAAEREATPTAAPTSAPTPAPTPAPPTNPPPAADGSIAVSLCAAISANTNKITLCDTNGLSPGMTITFGQESVVIVSIARRLSEEGRRLSTGIVTVNPAFQGTYNAGSTGKAAPTPTPTPVPPTNPPPAADGSITVTLCADIKANANKITLCDINGLVPGMTIKFGGEAVIIVSVARRLSEEGRRLLAGNVTVNPAFQGNHVAGTQGTASATPAPTPLPAQTTTCNGAVNPSCVAATSASGTMDIGEQFSCATVGKPEAAMMSVCAQFKIACKQPQDAAWLNNRPRCNGVVPQHP